jgi:hypothetical protein
MENKVQLFTAKPGVKNCLTFFKKLVWDNKPVRYGFRINTNKYEINSAVNISFCASSGQFLALPEICHAACQLCRCPALALLPGTGNGAPGISPDLSPGLGKSSSCS